MDTDGEKGGVTLIMQNDGHLVLYKSGTRTVLWGIWDDLDKYELLSECDQKLITVAVDAAIVTCFKASWALRFGRNYN